MNKNVVKLSFILEEPRLRTVELPFFVCGYQICAVFYTVCTSKGYGRLPFGVCVCVYVWIVSLTE